MVIPDINLLVYAYNGGAPLHEPARRWLEDLFNGERPVGIPWIVTHGFIRIMTHPRIMERPLVVQEAIRHVGAWLQIELVTVPVPGPKHLTILNSILSEVGSAGNLTSDAVLAALAIEYQAELHSNDADFSRFSGLRWRNPLR